MVDENREKVSKGFFCETDQTKIVLYPESINLVGGFTRETFAK